MVSGCGGCGSDGVVGKSDSKKSSSAKSKTRKKPDYEIGSLGVMPGRGGVRRVKPGHWATATHEVTANNFDAACDFRAEMRENGQSLDWPGTPYRLHTSQPAQLPKGKTRYLQTLFFVPLRSMDKLPSVDSPTPECREDLQGNISYEGKIVFVRDLSTHKLKPAPRRLQLSSRLQQRGGGLIQEQQPALTVMKPHEFQFVVLSPQAVGYAAWRKLDSLRPLNPKSEDDENLSGRDTHYHLVIPPIVKDRPPPLPSHPLTWTSIAYVLWDELDPLVLSAQQQQALLDWLHWGGRLIVSGPKSLDLLRGSFLAPYLPATSERAIDIEPGDLQPLSDFFQTIGKGAALRIAKPWAGVKLAPQEDAEWIRGTGELVAERRVGRGQIVVTAFRLRERELFAWSHFDSFLNTVLLRRGPRALIYEDHDDKPATPEVFVDVQWNDMRADRFDPQRISEMRYFSRDFGGTPPGGDFATGRSIMILNEETRQKNKSVVPSPPRKTPAGWDDYSSASGSARDALRDAAGINIPEAGFIIWVMAVYLIVLVPMNWGVFRLLGRVELAWVAAPLITLIFTVAVVKLAQLDIGFARSRTEFCIVEAQGGYARAHVTRYTALYASLSTSYEFEFEDDSALIGPFPSGNEMRASRVRMKMTLRRAGSVTAEGFNVSSNSTGIVHSEQMFDLGGAIRLVGLPGTERIANGSTLSLQGVAVIQRTKTDRLKVAWIGELAAGEEALLDFTATTQADALEKLLRQAKGSASSNESSSESPNLNLGQMLRLAHDHRPLKPGESRLIAWSNEEVPGMQISPSASQVRRVTLVVVHLRYALDRKVPQLDKIK